MLFKSLCRPSNADNNNFLYAQSHDGIDNIVVVLLECLDSLLPTHACLCHDQLNVLGLETSVIDLLAIILFLFLLSVARIDSLALVRVIVAGVVTTSTFLVGELLSSRSLGLRVEVLDLGLSEDAAKLSVTASRSLRSPILTSRCCSKVTCTRLAG